MKIGIYGYGNLGRGEELAVRQNPDMELFGVFTRRDPKTVKTLTGAAVYAAKDAEDYAGLSDDYRRRQRVRPAGDDPHAGKAFQRGGFL